MKLIMAIFAIVNWYYFPYESPSAPVEVEGVDVNLKRDELAFTFLALSDGEAALIQYATGENILVNTGGKGTMKELERLLALFHVKNISTVILTSSSEMENLEELIRKYDVGKVVSGKAGETALMEKGIPAGVKVEQWKQGDLRKLLPGLTAEVVFDGDKETEGTDISFQFFHHQIFYISSASRHSEQAFLAEPLRNVNIIKLPAYGAKGSFSDLLIEHMDPQLAIIFKSNSIKPDPDLVEMLHEAWIDVYFTKQHGTVTIKFTQSTYDVITIMGEE
ncbi:MULTISPECIES: ATP-dependent DNA helicase [unclassified Mesobacillus]|uniref:ComEC/Rec2 family competence protein n=1 Tax=unclassified Mesobacillus TaxID=2675270 RepID=UPI0020403ECF|nr:MULTISPECIES: ATP-dependent DNA helicase [unclassified Mesobacillus]MCM3122168.1 ATP-dependent DNA helicase [Mesobacillus sp. MER 33]MCM3232132.1 ATP-dependent DNA helicase [Mesobacillus sp. MER 48]